MNNENRNHIFKEKINSKNLQVINLSVRYHN